VRVVACSSAYESAPWGPVDQPPFLNAVAELDTTLPPHDLLALLLATEAELGRVRDVRWGPRTCDLDLLLYGEQVVDTPDLQVPHPLLGARRFVLDPLLELAPEARLPDGRPLAPLRAEVGDQDVRRVPDVSLH
jgi:2-amino-4-hydroxy-6-hydroxymethyldihydropteridine diphosphokinase